MEWLMAAPSGSKSAPTSRGFAARFSEWRGALARWWWGSRRGAGDPLGARGEREAERHLKGLGFQVLGRNVRLRGGEIDLLCLAPDERTIVVVEVKTRERSSGVYRPEAAITARKRRTLARLAQRVQAANKWQDRPIRVDVVAIELGSDGRRACRHYVAAVRA
jgi:putative endonuclease